MAFNRPAPSRCAPKSERASSSLVVEAWDDLADERVKREETEVENASKLEVWDADEYEGEGDLGKGVGVDVGAMVPLSGAGLCLVSSHATILLTRGNGE